MSGVFRLIYSSHNRIPHPARKAELGRIFSVARAQNKRLDVTGALLLSDDWFVQALEGPEDVVRELYQRISRDRRHERVHLLEAREVDGRAFGRWAMARVSRDGEPDIPLLTNTDRGGITPAAPRPTTDAQEAVLTTMRAAVLDQPNPV